MSRKIQKTLNLRTDVADRLETEDNQSRLVEYLLREHYGMETPDRMRGYTPTGNTTND